MCDCDYAGQAEYRRIQKRRAELAAPPKEEPTNCPTCGSEVTVGGKEGSTHYYIPKDDYELRQALMSSKLAWEKVRELEMKLHRKQEKIHEQVEQLAALRSGLEDWRNLEARLCPEDVGFEEWIKTLTASNDAIAAERTRAEVENLRLTAELKGKTGFFDETPDLSDNEKVWECNNCGVVQGSDGVPLEVTRLTAELSQLRERQPSEADVEFVEEQVGYGAGAWDMVKPLDILNASWARLRSLSEGGQ